MNDSQPLLPAVTSIEAYRPLYARPEVWLPAIRVIAERHGLDAKNLLRGDLGTHVAFRAGDGPWIKLFAPFAVEDHVRERTASTGLAGLEEIETPQILAEGTLEDWPYLVMTHLGGVSIGCLWPNLHPADQQELAEEIGTALARLHALPTDGLEPIATDWPAFLRTQREGCVARQEQSGVASHWLEEIAQFLADPPALDEHAGAAVLLHADVTADHLLIDDRKGKLYVRGLIDWGDAMLGHAPYEFVAPGADMMAKRPLVRRSMFRTYGYTEADLDAEMTRKLFIYTLLHRFATIDDLLKCCPGRKPTNLAELEQALWSFA